MNIFIVLGVVAFFHTVQGAQTTESTLDELIESLNGSLASENVLQETEKVKLFTLPYFMRHGLVEYHEVAVDDITAMDAAAAKIIDIPTELAQDKRHELLETYMADFRALCKKISVSKGSSDVSGLIASVPDQFSLYRAALSWTVDFEGSTPHIFIERLDTVYTPRMPDSFHPAADCIEKRAILRFLALSTIYRQVFSTMRKELLSSPFGLPKVKIDKFKRAALALSSLWSHHTLSLRVFFPEPVAETLMNTEVYKYADDACRNAEREYEKTAKLLQQRSITDQFMEELVELEEIIKTQWKIKDFTGTLRPLQQSIGGTLRALIASKEPSASLGLPYALEFCLQARIGADIADLNSRVIQYQHAFLDAVRSGKVLQTSTVEYQFLMGILESTLTDHINMDKNNPTIVCLPQDVLECQALVRQWIVSWCNSVAVAKVPIGYRPKLASLGIISSDLLSSHLEFHRQQFDSLLSGFESAWRQREYMSTISLLAALEACLLADSAIARGLVVQPVETLIGAKSLSVIALEVRKVIQESLDGFRLIVCGPDGPSAGPSSLQTAKKQ